VEKITDKPSLTNSNPADTEIQDFLVFTVQDIRIAVPASLLEHVVRMVAITPVPDSPSGIQGIINYHGEVLPVFSFRRLFSLPEKIPEKQDFLLIVNKGRYMALIAEQITGVFTLTSEIVHPGDVSSGIKGISGIYRCDDGLLIIAQPIDLLSIEDQEKIRALKEYLEI